MCKDTATDVDGFCPEHSGKKCCSCGLQATHDCDYCGQFVCGAPLCDACEGWHNGTPSVWGFIGHKHRRKLTATPQEKPE